MPGPEMQLALDILAELQRARAKFPGDNVTTLALVEEVGELAQATFEKSRAEVRKEAIQVACMAMRVILDGDATLDEWRAKKNLDPLTDR
jgi:NTP pyrophosphatase (non-canonical NTP hydrolase)